MRMTGKSAATVSLLLAATLAGTVMAENAKPAAPALSEVLASSGVTATGYVDGTYSYLSVSPPEGSSVDSNTFGLNQASLTLAYQPSSGFGALVNAVAGTEAGNGCYATGYLSGSSYPSFCGTGGSTSSFNLLQAYVQYISGKATVTAGKFTTLAGAEVAAPTGNVNITRSLLFWYNEPVTHVGARVAYAASGTATFTVGINNGWNVDSSAGSGKTLELGMGLTPSKSLALAGAAYYGDVDRANGLDARTLVDLVATWTVSPSLTIVGNVDWDKQEFSGGSAAKWWGAAAYANYAINDTWRTSLRLEYLDDQDGFATGLVGDGGKVNEGTLTFGYAPAKNFEFRFEGRYDTYKPAAGSDGKITQAWLQALFKF
jgi:Putative beta-barrel porin-2, OmpL-like. bbp2